MPFSAGAWQIGLARKAGAGCAVINLAVTVVVQSVADFRFQVEFAAIVGQLIAVSPTGGAGGYCTGTVHAGLGHYVLKLADVATPATVVGIFVDILAAIFSTIHDGRIIVRTVTPASLTYLRWHAIGQGTFVHLAVAIVIDKIAGLLQDLEFASIRADTVAV